MSRRPVVPAAVGRHVVRAEIRTASREGLKLLGVMVVLRAKRLLVTVLGMVVLVLGVVAAGGGGVARRGRVGAARGGGAGTTVGGV